MACKMAEINCNSLFPLQETEKNMKSIKHVLEETVLSLRLGNGVQELIPTRLLLGLRKDVAKAPDGISTDQHLVVSYAKSRGHEWFCESRRLPVEQFEPDILESFVAIRSKQTWRPKKLKVFLNPGCGKRDGKSIYADQIGPIFHAAEIEVDLTTTTRGGETRETLKSLNTDLSCFDGVVTLGGDGTYWEGAIGLIERAQLEAGVDLGADDLASLVRPSVTYGSIPTGSGCASANDTTGLRSQVTSALHIALGFRTMRDIISVNHLPDGRFLGFAALAALMRPGLKDQIYMERYFRPLFGPARYMVMMLIFLPLVAFAELMNGWGKPLQSFKPIRMNITAHVADPSPDDYPQCSRDCAYCERPPNVVRGSVVKRFVKTGKTCEFWIGRVMADLIPRGISVQGHTRAGVAAMFLYGDPSAWNLLKGILHDVWPWIGNNILDTFYSGAFKLYGVTEVEVDFSDNETLPELCFDGEFSDWSEAAVSGIRMRVHRHALNVFGAGVDSSVPAWDGDSHLSKVPFLKEIVYCFLAFIFWCILTKIF